jgi:Tfp pilus assembly protein PilE
MRQRKHFFGRNSQRGGMLVELMMTIALAAIIIPFVFRYQQTAVNRARNVAITKQMENVQTALERYIVENKTELMKPMGKNITRVKISDLVDYGLADYIAENYADDYQLRILKTADRNDKSVLQGIIILSNSEITPLRTREIVNLGGGQIGFIDGDITHGGFGAFHANTADFGISGAKGLVGLTSTKRGNAEYLWRLPSENESDATMLSPLNLDGHDITKAHFFDASKAQFEEKLKVSKLDIDTLVFSNRTNLNAIYSTNSAVVNGAFTSESCTLNVGGRLTLADSGKFSNFYTNDLYVNTLTLSGFTVTPTTGKSSTLQIIGDMDLILGHVTAAYVSVGYTGSVTPKLVISGKIQDPKDSSFYWDVSNKKARFSDANFPELYRMATHIVKLESVAGTSATKIFGAVAANVNATVGDYINAINSMQEQIRAKYQMLNLK